MSDQVTKVTKRGYGTRILDSIKGIFFGFLLFIASFVLLFWNEGKVNLADFAEQAVEVSATESNSLEANSFVSMTGELTTTGAIGDDYLRLGDYVAVYRDTEMFSWVEDSESSTKESIGGTETVTTTYTYRKAWESHPVDSSAFENPEGHFNPDKIIENEAVYASEAKVGIYSVNPANIQLPGALEVALTPGNTIATNAVRYESPKYLFKGKGNLQEPAVGDVRISYRVVPAEGLVTAFGRISGEQLLSYKNEEARFYRMFWGDRFEAIDTLTTEHKIKTWAFRIGGFLMMWIGLNMIVAVVPTLMAILPFAGNLTGFLLNIVTFIVAFVLSLITIVVSQIVHNIWALALVLVLIMAVLIYAKRSHRKA